MNLSLVKTVYCMCFKFGADSTLSLALVLKICCDTSRQHPQKIQLWFGSPPPFPHMQLLKKYALSVVHILPEVLASLRRVLAENDVGLEVTLVYM